MMSGKEKIYFLLDAIDDAREITPSGQLLKIHPLKDLFCNHKLEFGFSLDDIKIIASYFNVRVAPALA